MAQSPPVAFIVMPFSDDTANSVYRYSTRPLLETLNFNPIRADEIFGTNPIFDDIVTTIQQAALVVVDISGLNPNVMYELGMAHMLKRAQTVIITHDPLNSLPFDIRHFRIIGYENTIEGKTKFETSFRNTIQAVKTGLIDLYRSQFEVIERMVEPMHLHAIMALAQVTIPIPSDGSVLIEYHNKKGPFLRPTSVRSTLRSFIKLDYVRMLNKRIVLTEKGQLFVKYLELQGYKVDQPSDQSSTTYKFWFKESTGADYAVGEEEEEEEEEE